VASPENELSEASSTDGEISDEDDLYNLKERAHDTLPEKYKNSDRFRWWSATQEAMQLLRDDVTLPLKPGSSIEVFTDVDSGVQLPSWHCAFQNCTVTSLDLPHGHGHEDGIWRHICEDSNHHKDLKRIAAQECLLTQHKNHEYVLFTLYAAAVAEKARSTMPVLGMSTDRRTLQHVGEVLREDSVSVLMCFICACKHIRHRGYDLFGRPIEKGKIYCPTNDKVLRGLLHGSEEESTEQSFEYNLSCDFWKKRRLHEAVEMDPFFPDEETFEWSRRVTRHDVQKTMLCCPEDVRRSSRCKHEDTEVCWRCEIPVCNECYNILKRGGKFPRRWRTTTTSPISIAT